LALVVLAEQTLPERLQTELILFSAPLQQLAVAVALTSLTEARRVETALLAVLEVEGGLIRLLAPALGQEGLGLRVKVTLGVRLPVPINTQAGAGAVLEQLDQTQPALLAALVVLALILIQHGLLQLLPALAGITQVVE